ncbi:hypothetical protein DENIS_4046 [Desulfonema ishimotonii]|uniref:OmpA-like domain-containing protein n=1 Tax=Desulfonema ishimotonii TaxID=45657 RepID=A0A401G1I0_9BACT|nr:hypothetical protein [Desulfonema ishimotonii]GBC63057.1 hypothetical protein DENIS_4046 [Desulfonema ishimotonii]
MKLINLIATMLFCLLITSCATCPIPKEELEKERAFAENNLLTFEEGVRYISKEILCQMVHSSAMTKKNIKFGRFRNLNPAYRLEAKEEIQNLIETELISKFQFVQADSDVDPDYLLEGILYFQEKIPRLHVYVLENSKKIKIANASARFSSFEDQPTKADKSKVDSGRIPPVEDMNKIAKKDIGESVSDVKETLIMSELSYLIDNADALFSNGQYEDAVEFYKEIETEMMDKKLPETYFIELYDKMYNASFLSNNEVLAKKYLLKFISSSIEFKKAIDSDIHFEVGSDIFLKEKRAQNNFFVRVLGEYFKDKSTDLIIYGHSSCTGGLEYNCKISKKRAKKIKNIISNIAADIDIRAIGHAYVDARICRGEDEKDRRVEIRIIKYNEATKEDLLPCLEYARMKGI